MSTYAVLLRDRTTGEIRQSRPLGVPFDEGSLYWWTEGNMACDCNRALLFFDDLHSAPSPYNENDAHQRFALGEDVGWETRLTLCNENDEDQRFVLLAIVESTP